MNSNNLSSRARLEQAEALLRDVKLRDVDGDSSADASSLDGILVHLVNMQVAASSANGADANVAKRLKDFAQVMTRMNRRRAEPSERLDRLTNALNLASASFESPPTG